MTEPVEAPIAVALSRVMGDVRAVGKTGRNQSQNYSFRGIDAVINAVGPALRKHGVIVMPRVLSQQHRDFAAKNGGVQHEAILEVEYRFIASDGSELACSTVGESSDFSDKATTQAMSVAYRTALIQALCLPTDEPDPDESMAERAPMPAPMTAAQQKALAAQIASLDADQSTAVKGWWAEQRLPKLARLNRDQADVVFDHLTRILAPPSPEEDDS